MAFRCPSASIYNTGILNNWALVYRGVKNNAHATIIKQHGSIVPVVIWRIEPQDEYQLDIYEGYPNYYFKKDIMVNINGTKKKAMVYIMNPKCEPGRPTKYYIDTIYQGYIDNSLDINIFNQSLEINTLECMQI